MEGVKDMDSPDYRPFLFTLWLTFGAATLATTWTTQRLMNEANPLGQPQNLAQTLVLILACWLAGGLAGGITGALDWGAASRLARFGALYGGYAVALALRMIFWDFLVIQGDSFNILWALLTFSNLPLYDTFLLLVWLGGAAFVLLGLQMGEVWRLRRYDSPLALWGARLSVAPQALFALLALVGAGVLLLVGLRSWNELGAYADLTLLNTQWLTLPQTNMLMGALWAALVGGAWLCAGRWSALATGALAGMGHVLLMSLFEPVLSSYDPFYMGQDLNHVAVLPFLFFWLGVPLMMGVSAFALHNLREALSAPPLDEESAGLTLDTEQGA